MEMSEEKGSIEYIAAVKWGEYEGDIDTLKTVDKIWGDDAHELVRHGLRNNFIEGFKQGFMLRLTGDDDGC
jgi:hypothetical protein